MEPARSRRAWLRAWAAAGVVLVMGWSACPPLSGEEPTTSPVPGLRTP